VLLGLLGLVVYPILPDRFIDRWELINPRQAWITVIVIAGIGFINYVLLKIYGTRGVYMSGFLGGFVDSSAAAVELAKPLSAGGTSSGVAEAAFLLTIVAMFARNLLILALFSPLAVRTAAGPLLAMAIERVSILLGHQSVRVTEKHYSPWVRSRQEQLEADLESAWKRDPLVLLETKGTPEVHGTTERVN
jgi:uncharacterized membrane protein (DUF4010 family)